ncbi:hypothetical protein FHS31_002333 [Sphingomonas vulcanisoli]|uniref:Uncharacterized protein n=1 Tax=Sphingomonas vulcanisoli TaxID=1658060 RepID=A0ABX0TWE0_9SPHN|nr:hypothetical protein [Sphingomonas vulcanisoli]NIJ08712.1 hypothetical protein [Sphingomonas vulcanisoli]
MPDFSLYTRMREQGTLAETPQDVPDARFALPSTINWMRALALLVDDLGLNFRQAHTAYANVQRRNLTDRELNSVCEQLLFALHQLASLRALAVVENKADVARIAIMAWYYGVYGAASAMIAAGDGAFPDTHAATAQQWDRQFAATGLALAPFGDRLSALTTAVVEQELAPVRARGKHSLTIVPTSAEQAWGCHAEYLAGTAKWEQWNIQERVRETKDFKALGTESFRTAAARGFRDAAFARRGIAFLHEASRYRGKANYRDAIYLAYGRSVPSLLITFVDDLASVLSGFGAMAAAYASRRMGRDLWTDFLDDLEAKRSLSLSPKTEWS